MSPSETDAAADLPALLRPAATSRLWIGVAVCLALFVVAAVVAQSDRVTTTEANFVRSFRTAGDAEKIIGPKFFGEWMMETTTLGGYTVLTMLFVFAWTLLHFANDPARRFLLVSIAGGYVLHVGLKYLFARSRPDVVPHLVDAGMASFPSGHAFMSTVAYFSLAIVFSRWIGDRRAHALYFLSAAVLSVLIGVSRVVVGVHYPTDILGGWSAGLAWQLVCLRVCRQRGYLCARTKRFHEM